MKFFNGLVPTFMQQKNQKKITSSIKKNRYAQEISAVLFVALALFLSIAVFSYDPTDNSFFHYASNRTYTSNYAGSLGAQSSAFLFYLWGKAVYFFLGLLWSFVGCALFPQIFFIERIIGFCLLPFAAATLLTAFAKASFFTQFGAQSSFQGGFIGMVLWAPLERHAGHVGGFIVLYALLWICLLWIADYSLYKGFAWLATAFTHVMMIVGRYSFVAAQWLGTTRIAQALSTLREVSWKSTEALDDAQDSLLFKAATIGKVEDQKNVEKNKLWDELLELCNKTEASSAPMFPAEQTELDALVKQQLNEVALEDTSNKSFEITSSRALRLHATRTWRGRWKLLEMRNALVDITKKIDALNAVIKTVVVSQNESFVTIPTVEKKSVPFVLPSTAILEVKQEQRKDKSFFEKELAERGVALTEKLQHFGIAGKVTAIRPGPVITCFEYAPEADSKISKITALEDDLAMALSALSIRIVAPIPGRNVIGFEIANEQRLSVYLKEIAHSPAFEKSSARLPLMLGVDTVGNPVVCDLVTMPHLLVAGSTGSGKSVGMHSMLMSLLFSKTPEELKFVLIDPKRLEFVAYAEIPHLLFPIVTNPMHAAPVLKWIVTEMERRYECLARSGVRNIFDYHVVQKKQQSTEMPEMPFIVVMIDELADLMMVAGKEVEMSIARIAQMARAAGIYMILATQRPSVDVVTGLIKANFPSRIAFRVASKIDSRTILDASGAEKLLGAGDMLFMHSASSNLTRIHGAYVSEKEVLALTDHLKAQQKPNYISLEEVLKKDSFGPGTQDEHDELFEEVCNFVQTMEEISISMLQRHYRIGFNRSARLIEKLETMGIVAPAQGSKPRKVVR